MADNLEVALFGQRFEVAHAARPLGPDAVVCDLVGRHCESGDRLVAGRCCCPTRPSATCSPCRSRAPTASRWRTTTTARCGCRSCSRADGEHRAVVRRETHADLMARDLARELRPSRGARSTARSQSAYSVSRRSASHAGCTVSTGPRSVGEDAGEVRHRPAASPAAKAAPRTVASGSSARVTGRPSASASACSSTGFAVAPPSTRSSGMCEPGVGLGGLQHGAGLERQRLERRADHVRAGRVQRQAEDRAARRRIPPRRVEALERGHDAHAGARVETVAATAAEDGRVGQDPELAGEPADGASGDGRGALEAVDGRRVVRLVGRRGEQPGWPAPAGACRRSRAGRRPCRRCTSPRRAAGRPGRAAPPAGRRSAPAAAGPRAARPP